MAIEKSFGILKRRFPALRNGLRLNEATDSLLLISCAFIFHNICIIQKDLANFDNENAEDEEIDLDIPARVRPNPEAEEVRRTMIYDLF